MIILVHSSKAMRGESQQLDAYLKALSARQLAKGNETVRSVGKDFERT